MNTQVHTPGYSPARDVPLFIVLFLFFVFLKEIVDRVLNRTHWALALVVSATVPIEMCTVCIVTSNTRTGNEAEGQRARIQARLSSDEKSVVGVSTGRHGFRLCLGPV
jgi:hypothetical protein